MNRRDVFTGVVAAIAVPTQLIVAPPRLYSASALSLTLSEISRLEQAAMARATLSIFCDGVLREVAIGMAIPYRLLTKHYAGDTPP